jgi:hypothetical protein
MTSKAAPALPEVNRIDFIFEPATATLDLEVIQPLRLITVGEKATPKFGQILSSVREIGLVEPPVVVRDKDAPGRYLLLDGHMRVEALRTLGTSRVECLIATEDEAFTYNRRISRIAIVQEHRMILRAIERGVPEERIAQVFNVNVAHIRLKRRLLKGICPEAAELLTDKFVPMTTFAELRKMVAVRQVEAAQLMIAMNKFSINYAKSLVGATPQSQLVDSSQPKKVTGLSDAQMALMEQESASLDREFRLIEDSYGTDNLNLVVATRYIGRMLGNVRIVRYLAQHYPELLAEFQKIADPDQAAA